MKRFLLALIVILSVLFRLWVSQPIWLNGDENYYINIFQNFVDRGELTPYMWRLGGDTNIIAGSGTGYGIFILISWMSLVGESLFGVRMLMVLMGLITAWIYYLSAKKWWSSQDAGIAALVFGLVSTSSFYTLVGRMDSVAILSYSLVLLLHIWAMHQEKKWPHFWVGAAAILTTEFHILGLLYVVAFGFYYGVRYVEILVREKKFLLDTFPVYYFLGAGFLGVIYIVVHILPDPQAYFIIPSTCAICFQNPIEAELLRFSHILGLRPVEFILLILIFYFQIKDRKSDHHLLILFISYLISQIIIGPPPYIQYFHHMMPLISIGVGDLYLRLLSAATPKNQEHLKMVALALSFVLLGLTMRYHWAGRLPYENAYLLPKTVELDYIQENIPDSTVVMSTAKYFYSLREYRNFLDYTDQINYGLLLRNEDRIDFLNNYRPEVIYLTEIKWDEDPFLLQYIEDMDFVQVTPDLWVARDLVPQE